MDDALAVQVNDGVRQLLEQGQPEAAVNALRLALNLVRSATNAPEPDRLALDRRIQAQMVSTVQAEERIVGPEPLFIV